MEKLSRQDLLSLEDYAAARAAFRERVLAHKRRRQVPVGPNVTLSFEDRLTIQYQVQEMLRVERIFEASGIREELDAYNPLIPDGSNLKATMMIEFADPGDRREALHRLRGVEDAVWLEVGDAAAVRAIADEDLERSTEDKTSAVHFLRFELPAAACAAARRGAPMTIRIDHPDYPHRTEVAAEVAAALARDLDD